MVLVAHLGNSNQVFDLGLELRSRPWPCMLWSKSYLFQNFVLKISKTKELSMAYIKLSGPGKFS